MSVTEQEPTTPYPNELPPEAESLVRPVSMPVAFLVPRAFALSPLVRLGWGAIFGPLVW